MESGNILDDQIQPSSGDGKGRLNVDFWEPVPADVNPYITVSFETSTQITGITVKGDNDEKYYQTITIMYTLDGIENTLQAVSLYLIISQSI